MAPVKSTRLAIPSALARAQPPVLAAVADEKEGDFGDALDEPRERVQQNVERLDRIEAGDGADHEGPGREPERLAGQRPLPGEGPHPRGIDAVDDDTGASRRGEPERSRPARLALGDMDEGVCEARQAALHCEVPPAQARRVPRVVEPVKGVDGGDAGRASREPAIEAGALAVGVNELDPALPRQPHDRSHRAEREPVGGHLHHVGAEPLEGLHVRAAPGSGHGDGELGPRQPRDELMDMRRPAAEARRDQELEHAQRSGHVSVRARP